MPPIKLLGSFTLGLLVLLTIAAEPAPSKPRRAAKPNEPCAAEEVTITVIAILATEKHTNVDKRLDCLAKEVQKLHPKLTGYSVHKIMNKQVGVGGKLTFELIADQVVAVTVEQGADKENRVQLKVEPPQLGEIQYQTCCGKFMPIITPYRTKDNQQLLIAVRVQPCQGK